MREICLGQNGENSISTNHSSKTRFRWLKCCLNKKNDQFSDSVNRKRRLESYSDHSLCIDDIQHNDQHQLRRREIRAEARVTRSLAIVIGCFICCWFPFFTLYIIRSICSCLSFHAIEFFVWLGYSNSSINPVLYAILNKNFRLAFKNIFLSVKKVFFL